MRIIQINRQTHFGGGEVYTAFLCRALAKLGLSCELWVDPSADFWSRLSLPSAVSIFPVKEIGPVVPSEPTWLIGHGPLPISLRQASPRLWRTAIVHMPVQGRDPRAFAEHDMLFPVSEWVRSGLLAAGLPVWLEPLYGVADLERGSDAGEIRRRSRYDWDHRKVRDRLLSWIEPAWEIFRSHPPYTKASGIALGVVSRITPIKQFPLLFAKLAPVLARYPEFHLEVFGAGGYASVRDFDRALRPIASRVRFWGQQTNVGAVYRAIDYLLTGLPEKEALGLNVIEAQACGVPVLAPKAPPFTETVVDGVTGFLYRDPRQDDGEDFARLLARLQREPFRLDPAQTGEHLQRFSLAAFVTRLQPIVAAAKEALRRKSA